MIDAASLEKEVEALERLDLDGLRTCWRRHIGPPPIYRSRDLLRRMLAFELQAQIYGGLDAEMRLKLRQAAKAARKKVGLQPGTRITREWRGERHIVEITEDGVLHQGETYRSLSEVARAITGARWSGPRFFGFNDGAEARK